MKSRNSTPRISGYLAATVTLGTLASSAQAAIIQLDITSISGPNGGLAAGPTGIAYVNLQTLSPLAPYGVMAVANFYNPIDSAGLLGILAYTSMEFAIDGFIAPTNFPSSGNISATAFTGATPLFSLFENSGMTNGGPVSFQSPNFGPGSYMGFRVDAGGGSDFYYGWLEVTWDSASSTFEILSGAVNNTLNESITAGMGGDVSAIPEPGSALGTLGLLAAGMMIRTRRKKAA